MKPFSVKENQSLQKYRKIDPNIKSKVGRWKHFRKWFWRYLKVKKDCFEGSNVIFFHEVKTVFMESKSEPPKWFHFKVYQRQYFRNSFWSHLDVKNECSECLKIDFLIFLHIFQWKSCKYFLGKQDKAYKTV